MKRQSDKSALRTHLRAFRSSLAPEDLHQAGQAIADRVATLPELGDVSIAATYLAIRRELPTDPLRRALPGLRWAIPRVEGDTMVMVADEGERVAGDYGIPTCAGPEIEVDVVFVPGLAFDTSGRRLGWGGGYYDRWLARHRVLSIGLALDGAILDEVPHDAHDLPVDLVVTPTRVLPWSSIDRVGRY